MKKILLIGGGGYVGSVVSAHLLKLGYFVNVLDNYIYNHQFSLIPFIEERNFKFFYGNINDSENLSKASEGVDSVVIFAGLVGDPITKKYPNQSFEINEKGIQYCIDFYDKSCIKKLIFISTCSNYGLIADNEIADEGFQLNPISLYAKAKVKNEKYLLDKKGKVNYSGVVLRFATAFGLSPRMRFDLSISEFTKDIFFDRELLIYDENTWRPYCHVKDFARLIQMILDANKKNIDFEVFNAGGDENNFTKKMIVEKIFNEIKRGKILYAKNGSDARNYRVTFKKVKEILGFEPIYTIDYGVEELVNAFERGIFNDVNTDINKYGNYEIKI